MKSLSGHRYQAHWDAAGVDHPSALRQAADAHTMYRTAVALPASDLGGNMLADYRYLGLTLGPHPMALLRGEPEFEGCRRAKDLPGFSHQQPVQVAGVVTCRQRPGSASGVVFITLEDETGNSNIVVWNAVLARFRNELLRSRLIAVKGVVERKDAVIHVVARHVRNLTHKLDALSPGRESFRGGGKIVSGDASDSLFKARNLH